MSRFSSKRSTFRTQERRLWIHVPTREEVSGTYGEIVRCDGHFAIYHFRLDSLAFKDVQDDCSGYALCVDRLCDGDRPL